MKKFNIKNMAKTYCSKAVRISRKHAPVIFATAGMAGVVVTAVCAVKSKEKHDKVVKEFTPETTTKEKVVKLAPVWAPTVISGATTMACMGASTKISADRIASLTTALALSEKNLDIWKDKVQETTQEEEFSRYQEAVAQETLNRNPYSTAPNVYHTNMGDQLFFDKQRGLYFYSSKTAVQEAATEINRRLNAESYCVSTEIDINTFYDLLKLPTCELGEFRGWHEGQVVDLALVPAETDDGQTCYEVNYRHYLL